tara:strand:- start:394 stop:759 length:366 start_codon:yes stop_codon:yes gene_type:complete
MNNKQALESNYDEIIGVLQDNQDKSKSEVKKILMSQIKVNGQYISEKTAGRYYDRFATTDNAYLGLELNENKKEVNTMLTRSLISVINDINLLPIECDEDIKKQVELFKEVAIVNNTIKTY